MYNMIMNLKYMPQNPSVMAPEEAANLNPLVLSFVGDAVHTLFVRVKLASTCKGKTNALHGYAAEQINAKRQSDALRSIENMLTQEELNIFLRARNAKVNTLPKHASAAEYKSATGFEAIIGYLYLTGKHERLNELISAAYGE
jgi:ribonuclease-3 family protein